jgi:hypothetical protein
VTDSICAIEAPPPLTHPPRSHLVILVTRFQPLLVAFGFLFLWGASLTYADKAPRSAEATTAVDASTLGRVKSSPLAPWLCPRAIAVAEVESEDFNPMLAGSDGRAFSLRSLATHTRFSGGRDRPQDRRPATLVGTVVLVI